MLDPACLAAPCDRRRRFWATQPNCGAEEEPCETTCGVPGLSLVTLDCSVPNRCMPAPSCDNGPKTISTENYIRGLILNRLLTTGVRDATCVGFRPGLRGGHWSQAFVAPSYRIGSGIYQVSTKGPIAEVAKTAAAVAKNDLQSLVFAGVVRAIDVAGKYRRGGWIGLDVTYFGDAADPTLVGVVGKPSDMTWLWAADEVFQ